MLKKIKNKFINNIDLEELVKGSSITFLLKILGLASGYLFTVIVARYFGAETLGQYTLALTILNILTIFTIFGFDNALVKLISKYKTLKNNHFIIYFYKKSFLISFLLSFSLSIILFIFSKEIAINIFNNQNLISFIQIVSYGLIPMTILKINNAFFRGLKIIKNYAFFEFFSIFFFSLITISLFFAFNIKYGFTPILTHVIGIAISLSINFYFLYKIFPKHKISNIEVIPRNKELLKYSLPMLLTASITSVMFWADIIMLGIFKSDFEVGIYIVAVKLASLTSIFLIAVNSISAPKFSEMYEKKEMLNFEKLAKSSTKMIFFTSLPIILFITIFSEFILSFFGESFLQASPILLILMIGQFINSSCGSVGYILQMTGNQKIFQNIMILATVINIFLNYLLIPKYGILGAAIASLISMTTWNIISVFYVKKIFGFYTFPIFNLKK